MKKILITTFSAVAISGALGAFPAWSDPPSAEAEAKELHKLQQQIQQRMDQLEKHMAAKKVKALEAKDEQEAKTQISDTLSPFMKALEAFTTPQETKMSDINIPGLSGALPDNPFLKTMVNEGIKYYTNGSNMMNKASHTGGLVAAIGPLLNSLGIDSKEMVCHIAALAVGFSDKLCGTFFGAKK